MTTTSNVLPPPPPPPPPRKCFCKALSDLSRQHQTHQQILATPAGGIYVRVMGVILGFATATTTKTTTTKTKTTSKTTTNTTTKTPFSLSLEDDDDENDEEMNMNNNVWNNDETKIIGINERLVLDDGSGELAIVGIPDHIRTNTAVMSQLIPGLLADCVVHVGAALNNNESRSEEDGGGGEKELSFWIHSLVVWKAENENNESLLFLRSLEIQYQCDNDSGGGAAAVCRSDHDPNPSTTNSCFYPSTTTFRGGGGIDTTTTIMMQEELYEMIQSCASSSEEGTTLEELALVLDCAKGDDDYDQLHNCLQEMQLSGQIYLDSKGKYNPL